MRKLSLFFISFLFLSSCHQEAGFQTLSSLPEQRQTLASTASPSLANDPMIEREAFQLRQKQATIDFLILPDTSQSMTHHLKNLGESLSDLLYVISDYDWQMGFTSVDHGDYRYKSAHQDQWRDHIPKGKGRFGSLMVLENGSQFLPTKILSSRISNYENVFRHSLSHIPSVSCNRPPFCSSPVEQPLRSLKSAIERGFLSNRALFRSSSDYFVSILASNEDERKEDAGRATSPAEVIATFKKQFQNSTKKFLHYSIVVDNKDCLKKERNQNFSAGISYASMKLSHKTAGPGAIMSLCSQNYGSDLRVISQHIKNQVENSFFLQKDPIPNSVEVHFSRGPQVRWTLRGREILFDNKSYENIEGTVSYEALK